MPRGGWRTSEGWGNGIVLKQTDKAPLLDCRHCGTPVPVGRTDGFCCTGCGFVFNLLMEEGFGQFYDLKGGKMLSPVAPEPHW